jgi:hypothetical protein
MAKRPVHIASAVGGTLIFIASSIYLADLITGFGIGFGVGFIIEALGWVVLLGEQNDNRPERTVENPGAAQQGLAAGRGPDAPRSDLTPSVGDG